VNSFVKKSFSGFICRPYCAFFKEGQKEEMACGAAMAVATLVDRGLLSSESFPEPGSVDDVLNDDPLLFDLICRPCPFVLDGCDFRLPTPPADAVPCGGFVLLRALYFSGVLTPRMLRTV